ncbi:MAG TPA: MGMT family protein [Steroidobacteraceae bacterium]|nr:MGMT family protein [Steroidobacteraceae bacterium]
MPTKRSTAATRPAIKPVSNPAWEAIYQAVERIPRGHVATYGGIAHVAGLPRRARLVGTALKKMSKSRPVPWHRVLTASGKLAFPSGSDAFARQSSRLKREGVELIRGRVDLRRYGWPSSDRGLDELLWSPPVGARRAK